MIRSLAVVVLFAGASLVGGCAGMTQADDTPKICRTVKRTGSRIPHRECTDDTRASATRSVDQESFRQSNRGPKPGQPSN